MLSTDCFQSLHSDVSHYFQPFMIIPNRNCFCELSSEYLPYTPLKWLMWSPRWLFHLEYILELLINLFIFEIVFNMTYNTMALTLSFINKYVWTCTYKLMLKYWVFQNEIPNKWYNQYVLLKVFDIHRLLVQTLE